MGSRTLPHVKGHGGKFYLPAAVVVKVFPSLEHFYKTGTWAQQVVTGDTADTTQASSSSSARSSGAVGEPLAPTQSTNASSSGPSTTTASSSTSAAARPTTLRDLYAPAGRRWINGHELPVYQPPERVERSAGGTNEEYIWPPPIWRTYICWYVAEMTFRYELFALDDLIRRSYPDLVMGGQSALERQQAICDIWDSNAFVADEPNPLVCDTWTDRVQAVKRFYNIIRVWPRVVAMEADCGTAHSFAEFERHVWFSYAQTYFDYFAREVLLPSKCPTLLPFEHVS